MTKVNHDLRSNNGGTIVHLQETAGAEGQANLEIPNIFEQNESALYPIGTRLVLGDRTFHYCHFTTAITKTIHAVKSYSGRDSTYGQPASYDTEQAAGVGTVASPFKIDGTSASLPDTNYYAGAYIFIPVAVALGRPTMRILSSTAAALDATHTSQYTIELVLEQPTPVAVAANVTCDIFQNRYADVRATGTDMHAFVGLPLRIFTDEYYGWIQTWGPVFIVHQTADQIGDTAQWRTVVFNSDGSLRALHKSTATDGTSQQIAGYTLAVNGAGSEWTYLMIAP